MIVVIVTLVMIVVVLAVALLVTALNLIDAQEERDDFKAKYRRMRRSHRLLVEHQLLSTRNDAKQSQFALRMRMERDQARRALVVQVARSNGLSLSEIAHDAEVIDLPAS